MSRDAGKGDTYRPVNQKKWDEGYNRIFSTPQPKLIDDTRNNSGNPPSGTATTDNQSPVSI